MKLDKAKIIAEKFQYKILKLAIDTVEDSRWALCNESNEEVHVVDEGVVVGAGQVFGLMFVGSFSIVIHINDTILHTSNISQILRQVLGVKWVVPILGRRSED